MMSPEMLEKQSITLLNSELVKPKVLSTISEGLRRSGLAVTFRDIKLTEGTVVLEQGDPHLPDSIKDALADALIQWLREAVSS